MRFSGYNCRTSAGFTLVELAIVMAIVAFLLAGLMFTLSAQTEQRSFEETRRRLEQARELLLAFAVVNGRLPCPARSAATTAPATMVGDEVRDASGNCVGDGVTDYYGGTNGGVVLGLLPARTIGFQQVDSSGLAVDAWQNRIRYAVSGATPVNSQSPRICRPVSDTTAPVTPHFTNSTNLKANGIDCQPSDLLVCRTANVTPALSTSSCGGAVVGGNQIMTKNLVVAIIFSTGKNGATGGTAMDEAANLNGAGNSDPVFVYHTPTSSDFGGGEFDDQFVWITVGELYGKLISAGQLP